jgi:hypothetical protein
MLMPAPSPAARPTRNVCQVSCVAKAAANRRQGRDRAVHQAGQARLDHLQNEQPPPRGRVLLGRGGWLGMVQLGGQEGVLALLGGQVAQQLADAGVAGLPGCRLVEPPRLLLHRLRLLADGLQVERPHLPDRLAVDETLDVLAADQRDVLAKLLAVQLDEPVPVAVLLLAHLVERGGGLGVAGLEPLGKVAVNAGVLLLQGDGQGKHLLLAQALERSHGGTPFLSPRGRPGGPGRRLRGR